MSLRPTMLIGALLALLSSTTASACENWCTTNAQTWATKCAWTSDQCSGCAECDVSPPPVPPTPPSPPQPSPPPPVPSPPQSTCYVSSTTGSDSNDGSSASPVLTINQCITRVGSGGTCYLLPGTFREASAYNGSLITGVTDLTIALAPSAVGEATIDGTIDLTGWETLSDTHGTYYRTTAALGDSVWQVFVDGAPLTPARWPNALLWTTEWWDRGTGWAKQDTGSTCGTSVDNGTLSPAYGEVGYQSLAATGVSFDGCNMILNNEHRQLWLVAAGVRSD